CAPVWDQRLPINRANDIRKHGNGRLARGSFRLPAVSVPCASSGEPKVLIIAHDSWLARDPLPVGIDADLGPFALRSHTRLVGNDPAALRDRLHAGHLPLSGRRTQRITDRGGHIDELYLPLHFDDRAA